MFGSKKRFAALQTQLDELQDRVKIGLESHGCAHDNNEEEIHDLRREIGELEIPSNDEIDEIADKVVRSRTDELEEQIEDNDISTRREMGKLKERIEHLEQLIAAMSAGYMLAKTPVDEASK